MRAREEGVMLINLKLHTVVCERERQRECRVYKHDKKYKALIFLTDLFMTHADPVFASPQDVPHGTSIRKFCPGAGRKEGKARGVRVFQSYESWTNAELMRTNEVPAHVLPLFSRVIFF